MARNASYNIMFTAHAKLTLKYGHSLFRLLASAGCPKQDFQCNFIRVLRPDMTFGCGLANKIELHLNREQKLMIHYPTLSSRQEPQK